MCGFELTCIQARCSSFAVHDKLVNNLLGPLCLTCIRMRLSENQPIKLV